MFLQLPIGLTLTFLPGLLLDNSNGTALHLTFAISSLFPNHVVVVCLLDLQVPNFLTIANAWLPSRLRFLHEDFQSHLDNASEVDLEILLTYRPKNDH